MPSPEKVNLYDAVVLWAIDGTNDKYGNPNVGDPAEIRVRWDDKAAEAVDANGNTIKVDATAVVAQDIDIGSLMWLGKLADWLSDGINLANQGIMQVVTFSKTSDIRGRFSYRKVGLMRFKNIV